ncbi:MAG TPA: PPOX class F420-dependent oxidoreductase [Thermomicrobiales bacterium]|nr:PPOX class F420-dependent oxidoreductase [Thermomicrobiales bacterium]
MNQDQAMEYVAANHRGVLATLRRDGRPQLSHVGYMLDDDGLIKISVTRDRAKTRNAMRDDRVSLSIIGDDWYRYVVIEGRAQIIEDDPLQLLRHVYVGIFGKEHPNWQEFDEAMVRERRVVMAISIDRLYPLD